MRILFLMILFLMTSASFAQTCNNYDGNWGSFNLRQVNCDKVEVVTINETTVCRGWPYCQDTTRVNIFVDAIFNTKTGECSLPPGKHYHYFCSAYENFKFRKNMIQMTYRAFEGKYVSYTDTHGQCTLNGRKLILDETTGAIYEQEDLYDCEDGFKGWSQPVFRFQRKVETAK